jgi:hypothetical protein
VTSKDAFLSPHGLTVSGDIISPRFSNYISH